MLTTSWTGLMAPDPLVAFNADPQAYDANNSYVISEQGKPSDFVLEIASRGAGRKDITTKREGHAALGVPESGGSTTQWADTMTYRSRGTAW